MDAAPRIRRRVGAAAVAFSALYLLSDVIEAVDGGFSTGQLWLTLVAEAAIPPLIVALWLLQRPRLGRLGAAGAIAYAAVYVFFTATVVYALADGTPDFATLSDDLSPWMLLGGAGMVLAGLAFGVAVARAGVLPAWTAGVFVAGVVLVAATDGAPAAIETAAAAVRDLGVAAMGAALAHPVRPRRAMLRHG